MTFTFSFQYFSRKQRGRYWARFPAPCDHFQRLALFSPKIAKKSWTQKRNTFFEGGGPFTNEKKEQTPNRRSSLFRGGNVHLCPLFDFGLKVDSGRCPPPFQVPCNLKQPRIFHSFQYFSIKIVLGDRQGFTVIIAKSHHC